MNSFFTDTFNISKIDLCVHVRPDNCRLIHKNRPTHGLVIMLNGTNKYVFDDGSEMTVNKGELFYLPKFSNYRVEKLTYGECIAVNFELIDKNITYPHFALSDKYGVKYTSILKELLSAWDKCTPVSMNICFSKLYELICTIQFNAERKYLNSHSRKIAIDGAEYIAQNICRSDLTIDEISKAFNITPEYFRKLFNSEHGISPKRYMMELRITKAKELLSTGEFTVSNICTLCGYEDTSYFCREFKRITGQTPTEYGNSQ